MRSALISALVLITVACARPVSTQNQVLPTPTPTPSPTPTAPLAATSAPFHMGEVGLDYDAVAFSATGGVQPYTWSVSAGSIPDGLTLASDGSVSGTPTSAGNFSFTIQVADSGGSTATVSAQIGIAAHLSAGLVPACAARCSVELGCVSVCGAFGQVNGGVGPYSYTQTSGQLPAGTALSGLSLTGTFTGLTGYLQFTVQVTDSLGVTASIAPTFWMYKHISFAGGTIPVNRQQGCFANGAPGSPGCTAQFPYSGGTPGAGTPVATASWVTYTCAAPPPMPAITVSGSQVIVAVPGYRANCNGYTGTLSVVLTNRDLCGSGPTYCKTTAPVYIQQSGT